MEKLNILITGGARGLGKEIAKHLQNEKSRAKLLSAETPEKIASFFIE